MRLRLPASFRGGSWRRRRRRRRSNDDLLLDRGLFDWFGLLGRIHFLGLLLLLVGSCLLGLLLPTG